MHVLYAFVGVATGRVRIGTTRILAEDRLRQLQQESPDDLELLGQSEAHAPLERRVHAALARHRRRGDWYEREVGDAIRAASAFAAWLDALLGPRAAAGACLCGAPATAGGLTCGAALCVRRAKGRRTRAGLVIAVGDGATVRAE